MRHTLLRLILTLAFTGTVMQLAPIAMAQGYSYADPAGIGTPVTSILQLGPMNTTNYDATITVLETARGETAMDRLQAANAAVAPPAPGHEYLLARIRFALQGRAVTDIDAFALGNSPFQWLAYSSQLQQYPGVEIRPPPPALAGPVRSGTSAAGWVVLAVGQSEHEPLLVFDPSAGGATGRGNLLFFKLY
jgi:hypothetical protein